MTKACIARLGLSAFLTTLGLVALVWSLSALPALWRMSLVKPTADDILEGQSFSARSISELKPIMGEIDGEPFCEPLSLRSASIIRFYEAQTQTNNSKSEFGGLSPVETVRRSLACTPTDSFLWLALFVTTVEEEPNDVRFRYLRMSYKLGPHEGWIALQRNRSLVSIYDELPVDLQRAVVQEFAEMVSNHLYPDAVAILLGPGWQARSDLVGGLTNIPERSFNNFAGALRLEGYLIEQHNGGIHVTRRARP